MLECVFLRNNAGILMNNVEKSVMMKQCLSAPLQQLKTVVIVCRLV